MRLYFEIIKKLLRKKGGIMTDLKLIDELLCDIKQSHNLSWKELETWTSVTRKAMIRLKNAYETGEMPIITLGLAEYFFKKKF